MDKDWKKVFMRRMAEVEKRHELDTRGLVKYRSIEQAGWQSTPHDAALARIQEVLSEIKVGEGCDFQSVPNTLTSAQITCFTLLSPQMSSNNEPR